MKPDTKLKNYQSTATDGGTRMSIDEGALSHIMDVLTKLYNNPRKACVREYSTNALDSHREAGNPDPIKVTLPTQNEPTLTIQDWGVGMDADGIEEIYSRYGTSTKRESNEVVGMLGLGCKSALAYGDQFTLTGVKNGRQTEVLVSRDEDGAGTMTVVAEFDTAERDGVTVSIPIKSQDIAPLCAEADVFFSFWNVDDVRVNGQQPKRIGMTTRDPSAIWLSDTILLTKAVDEDLVVMGNVPYPLPDSESSLFNTGSGYRYDKLHAVCFVPIGAVQFAPSRESLMDTKRTRAALDHLRKQIVELRDKSCLDQIANAKDAKDAQDILRRSLTIGFDRHITPPMFKGREVRLSLERGAPKSPSGAPTYTDPDDWASDFALKHSYLFTQLSGYTRRKSGSRGTTYDLSKNATVFEGFDGKALTNVKRSKLDLWNQQNGGVLGYCMFVDKLTPDERFWLDGHEVVQWSEVDAIKLPSATGAGGTKRVSGSYNVLVDGDRYGRTEMQAHDIAKSTKTVYYDLGNHWTVSQGREYRSGAVDLSDSIVVCLQANRVDKFRRDFPNVKLLNTAAKEAAQKWQNQQTPETIKAYSIQRGCPTDHLTKLDASALDDPLLRQIVRHVQTNTNPYTEGRSKYALWLNNVEDAKAVKWANDVLAKYKLLDALYRTTDTDHLVLYLNAAYAQQKGA